MDNGHCAVKVGSGPIIGSVKGYRIKPGVLTRYSRINYMDQCFTNYDILIHPFHNSSVCVVNSKVSGQSLYTIVSK